MVRATPGLYRGSSAGEIWLNCASTAARSLASGFVSRYHSRSAAAALERPNRRYEIPLL